jgi:transposase
MTDLFLLSRAQMRRIVRSFPLSHGVARVDDRRIVSAIVFVIKNGLRWRDAPPEHGPHKAIYNRFVPWEPPRGVQQDFRSVGAQGPRSRAGDDRRHASEGPSHRREPFKKGPVPRRIGRDLRRLERQAARRLRREWTAARHALERGADERRQGRRVDTVRHAESQTTSGRQGLRRRRVPRRPRQAPITPCIPAKANRKTAIPHDAVLLQTAPQDRKPVWAPQRLAAHPHPIRPLRPTSFSAIGIAAAIIFWL